MTYELIGDMPAPSLFAVSPSSGDVTVRQNLKSDDEMQYVVRFTVAYNSATDKTHVRG